MLFHMPRTAYVTLKDLSAFQHMTGWVQDPIISNEDLHKYRFPEDANFRRIRDAQSIGLCCRNVSPSVILEIGTGIGTVTWLMSENAPDAQIYTVNIPPEEIAQGGTFTTFAPDRSTIGSLYREKGCRNVIQILANTATWKPDLPKVDIAFIDGCHDTEFVIRDTELILPFCKPGSWVIWHDFCPELAERYEWMSHVQRGVYELLMKNYFEGPVLHLQDSFVGMARIAKTSRNDR
jgi:predicted O-methyltransferase YrrM